MKLTYSLVRQINAFKVFILLSTITFLSIISFFIFLNVKTEQTRRELNSSINWKEVEEVKKRIESEKEYEQSEALKVLDQETNVLGESDKEVDRIPVGYKEELVDWSGKVGALLYVVDDTYYLIDQNDEKQLEYIDLLDLFGTTCIFKDYPYSKSDIPNNYLIKVNNVEKLLPSFCEMLVEDSKLLKEYKNSNDIIQLEKIYREEDILQESIYIKGDIIYRLLEDIEKIGEVEEKKN